MQSVRFRIERSVIKWLRTTFRKKKELKFNEFNLSAELLAEIEKDWLCRKQAHPRTNHSFGP